MQLSEIRSLLKKFISTRESLEEVFRELHEIAKSTLKLLQIPTNKNESFSINLGKIGEYNEVRITAEKKKIFLDLRPYIRDVTEKFFKSVLSDSPHDILLNIFQLSEVWSNLAQHLELYDFMMLYLYHDQIRGMLERYLNKLERQGNEFASFVKKLKEKLSDIVTLISST